MKTVVEYVAYKDGKPVYSGSRIGALHAAMQHMQDAKASGQPEPGINFKERTVEYHDDGGADVSEKDVTI